MRTATVSWTSVPCCAVATVADTPDDPGSRGSLTVRDKAAERVAHYAALHVPGVLTHSGGLDRITGRDLPRVAVTIAGGHVRAHLDIAVAWPQSLPEVSGAVRVRVSKELSTLVGLVVDAVDVAVPTVLIPDASSAGRTLQ